MNRREGGGRRQEAGRGAGSPVAGRPVAGGPVAGGPVAGGPVAGRPVAGRPVVVDRLRVAGRGRRETEAGRGGGRLPEEN